jgi:Ribbon-helix-helix protein, copG family
MPEKKTHGTSRGHVIDDDTIETLAAEAEAGYDVTKLRRRGGRQLMGTAPAEVVPVRLDPDLRDAIERRAEADHTTASDIIRTAIRQFLHVA